MEQKRWEGGGSEKFRILAGLWKFLDFLHFFKVFLWELSELKGGLRIFFDFLVGLWKKLEFREGYDFFFILGGLRKKVRIPKTRSSPHSRIKKTPLREASSRRPLMVTVSVCSNRQNIKSTELSLGRYLPVLIKNIEKGRATISYLIFWNNEHNKH